MIQIKNISKSYNGLKVLDNISLSIQTNKITAIIAPNGEGKTTLLNLLIGAIHKNSGEIILEKNITQSVMSENEEFIKNYKVKDVLYQQALLYDKSVKRVWDHPSVTIFELDKLKNKYARKLSKGFRKKLAISKALITDSDFVIMDEPFDGIDVISRDKLITLLEARKAAGSGSLITTHIIHNLDRFCDVIVFLKEKNTYLTIDNSTSPPAFSIKPINGENGELAGEPDINKKESVSDLVHQNYSTEELYKSIYESSVI